MTINTGIIPEAPANGLNSDVSSSDNFPQEGLRREAIKQIANEKEIEVKEGHKLNRDELRLLDSARETEIHAPYPYGIRGKFRKLLDFGMSKKTIRLLIQIWQSDYSIIAFVFAVLSFYLMKGMNYPPLGVLFFLLAMAVVDSILSIFVTRLSFLQNKHGYYRSDDFERDWLRYKILLSMTKAALLFVVGTSCGTAAVVGSYVMWFF